MRTCTTNFSLSPGRQTEVCLTPFRFVPLFFGPPQSDQPLSGSGGPPRDNLRPLELLRRRSSWRGWSSVSFAERIPGVTIRKSGRTISRTTEISWGEATTPSNPQPAASCARPLTKSFESALTPDVSKTTSQDSSVKSPRSV